MSYSKEFYKFVRHLITNRILLKTLVVNDFKKHYLGSYLGLLWAFIQPLTFMLVIWFVFTCVFRSAPHSDTPYFLWLASGMIPWFFVSIALSTETNAIINNFFLVKKAAFRVSTLPFVQIGSALFIHVGLILFLMVVFLLYGFAPSIYWFQLPYFILCSVLLLLGIIWMTSAIRVFIKDIGNIIGVLLQIGFWTTPIFWNITMISPKHQWILKLNPAYYIVQGYRDTFINHIWFWKMPKSNTILLGHNCNIFSLGAHSIQKAQTSLWRCFMIGFRIKSLGFRDEISKMINGLSKYHKGKANAK